MRKYKIYINESPLWLWPKTDEVDLNSLPKTLLHAEYRGRSKMLFNYIDLLEKSSKHDGVIIQAPDMKVLWKDFKSIYVYVKAGGGIVRRKDGKILLIHRLGYWDLPKGKQDPNEKLVNTALREVEEEVGFHHLDLEYKIGKTYHSFKKNTKRVLKKTLWYAMYTSTPEELTLQYSEGIDDAAWIDPKGFSKLKLRTYRSVDDIIAQYNDIQEVRKGQMAPKPDKKRPSKGGRS